jgi:hypothetical protein
MESRSAVRLCGGTNIPEACDRSAYGQPSTSVRPRSVVGLAGSASGTQVHERIAGGA